MHSNGSEPHDRLPPPAFPPGSSRRIRPEQGSVPEDAFISPDAPIERGSIPEDAIFSPDDPVTRSGTRMPDDAFFSPDEPVVREAEPTVPEDFEDVLRSHGSSSTGAEGETEGSEGQVTGMSLEVQQRGRGGSRFDDPHVERLYAKLVGLTKAVKERGEAGLRTEAGMSRFETTLRGYCVGYLAGLREPSDPES